MAERWGREVPTGSAVQGAKRWWWEMSPWQGRRVWVPGKLWGSKVLTPLSGMRAPLSGGSLDKSVGPAHGAGGRGQCLPEKWQRAVEGPSLFNQPKAKGAADGKRGRAGCSSPSLSSSTSLKPPLSFDSRGLLINLPALKGQTGSTESRLTCAPAHTRRGAQMPLPPRSPSK